MAVSEQKFAWAPLAFLLAVGAGLRLLLIGGEQLWFDEALSVWFAHRPIAELWIQVPIYETHPPLYYTLLKGWISIFGDSEACLRGLSALAGVGAIPLAIRLGRRVAAPGAEAMAGFLAGALLTFSPTHIYFSQEARPYALLVFSACLALWGAFWLTANPAAAARPILGLAGEGGRGRAPLAWGVLIIGSVLSLWSHNLGLFVVTASLIALSPLIYVKLQRPRAFVINILLAGALILALWAPFLPTLCRQAGNVSGQFWMSMPDGRMVSQGLGELFLYNITAWPLRLLILALALWGLRAIARDRGRGMALAIAGLTLIPIALALVISFTFKPIFAPRTLLWIIVPFYVAVSAGLAEVARRHWLYKGPVFALTAMAFLWGDYIHYTGVKKEPWRDIVQSVASRYEPGDKVLLLPNSLQAPFTYYAGKEKPGMEIIPLPAPFPAMGMDRPYPTGNMAEPGLGEADLELIGGLNCQSSSVWLVIRLPHLFDPGDRLARRLASQCQIAERGSLPGIRIYRFLGRKADWQGG